LLLLLLLLEQHKMAVRQPVLAPAGQVQLFLWLQMQLQQQRGA
jgi:hypothetical protein